MKEIKSFYVYTYGCQMNELDSAVMIGQLMKRGLVMVDNENLADLLIFNTCSVRDLAERKVMGKIGQLGRKTKRKQIIGVTGCMAMSKKETLFSKLPNISFVLGTNNINDLNAVLDDVLNEGGHVIHTDKDFGEDIDFLSAQREDKIKAYVSIIRGCDKRCTYCIVPYTRGKEVSRPPQDILDEVEYLVRCGYKEITLLGQNVNSYGKDRPEWNCLFHDLLYRLDKTGVKRIRFLTSHPVDIKIELIEAIRDLPSVCKFVHFPMQGGSDRILRKMHRIYTKEEYQEKVALLREIIPNVALGTDIIVGFPTETDEEFQETYDIFKKNDYSIAFIYTYSARKGTPAYRWEDDVPEQIKEVRLQKLLQLHNDQCIERHKKMLGETTKVLIERRNKNNFLKGRNDKWDKVVINGSDSLIGTIQDVKIHTFNHQTLIGSLI